MKKDKRQTQMRKNFRFPADLAEWVDRYAEAHNTTTTQILVDYLTDLRRRVEAADVQQF